MRGISERGVGATFCHLTAKLNENYRILIFASLGPACGVLILSFSFHRRQIVCLNVFVVEAKKWSNFALDTCHVGVNYMLLRHTLYGAGLIYWGDSKF